MNESKERIAAQRLHDGKQKESAERVEQKGREWMLRPEAPPEGQWFLEARDLMADSTDAWQLRWDEVAEEFTKIVEIEDFDAAII